MEDEDRLIFDLGAVYQRLYAETRFFGAAVDYAQDPINFHRYTPADQKRIRARMEAIALMQPHQA